MSLGEGELFLVKLQERAKIRLLGMRYQLSLRFRVRKRTTGQVSDTTWYIDSLPFCRFVHVECVVWLCQWWKVIALVIICRSIWVAHVIKKMRIRVLFGLDKITGDFRCFRPYFPNPCSAGTFGFDANWRTL